MGFNGSKEPRIVLEEDQDSLSLRNGIPGSHFSRMDRGLAYYTRWLVCRGIYSFWSVPMTTFSLEECPVEGLGHTTPLPFTKPFVHACPCVDEWKEGIIKERIINVPDWTVLNWIELNWVVVVQCDG
jgi:hypothetical protein